MDKENFENFVDNYNIEEDIIYQDFMKIKANRTGSTKQTYKKTLVDLCNANMKPLNEIFLNCKEEQRDRIVDDEIIKFSPNDIHTNTKQYFNNFLAYIEINKSPYETERAKNRNSTINHKVALLKAFFDKYDLKLPDYEKKDEDDSKDWQPLSKKDIEYIVNDSTLEQTALWSFMMSTGMRESDCVNLKVRDFMEATQKMGYHNFVDVNEFIDNAPQDMVGFWEFIPQKTKKDKILCMTFNNRESSNYILQSLRKIKNDYLPRHNKKHKKDLKISKDSALFGSRTYNYLGHRNPNSITQSAHKKNKKLREHYITQIEEKIANGKIGEEDKEEYIKKIPVFHGHQLRRYFITTIRRHAQNLSYSAMMEGHAPPLPNDPSYVNITKEDVEEIYNKAIYDLSLFEVDEKKLIGNKVNKLQKELDNANQTIKDLKEMLKQQAVSNESWQNKLEDRVAHIEKGIPQFKYRNPLEYKGIKVQITDYIHDLEDEGSKLGNKLSDFSPEDIIVLRELAFSIVVDEGVEVDKAVKKALIRLMSQPELLEEGRKFTDELTMNAVKLGNYKVMLIEIVDGVLLEDITEEYILNDIEKFI